MSRPREGWLSLALLLVIVLAVAWSVQGAEWLNRMDFLVPVALFGVASGTALALTTARAPLAIVAGAFLGAAVVIWTVGGEYFTPLDQLGRLLALRDDLLGWLRIALLRGYPPQMSPYAVALGMLMWVTAFSSAFALFRHHRALDTVLVAGSALVANMAATYTDLFGYLLLFVVAALLLLLRSALSERQLAWRARRVSETEDVPATIMRSGLVFASVSVVLALVLTNVAVAAPLQQAWGHLDSAWSGVSGSFRHLFMSVENASSRLGGPGFISEMPVTGRWESRDEIMLEVAADRPHYLRTVVYDEYTGNGWRLSSAQPRTVDSEADIFPASSLERPTVEEALRRVTITVAVTKPSGQNVFTPGYPVRAYLPLVVRDTAGLPLFGALEAAVPVRESEGYQITADVSVATEAELASASTDYPQEIAELYLGTDGVSDETRQLAAEIAATAEAQDPYHRAKAVAGYLSSSPFFTYANEAPVPGPNDGDLVHFFLFNERGRTGYCQYFASAMVVMARTLGLPARLATGYAPGERTEDGDRFIVRQSNAHAWAEIYFPGYGWQIFEATKSIDPQFTRAAGNPGEDREAGTGAAPVRTNAFDQRYDDAFGNVSTLPSFRPVEGGRSIDGAEQGSRPPLAIPALLLAAAAVGGAYLVWRRRRTWGALSVGDGVWRQLESTARRAGVSPRASETVYEYAGWLENQIPSRRPEIRTVADGKVWVDYSGRPMPPSWQERIRRSWRRLRMPLWLLIARRRAGAVLSRSDDRS